MIRTHKGNNLGNDKVDIMAIVIAMVIRVTITELQVYQLVFLEFTSIIQLPIIEHIMQLHNIMQNYSFLKINMIRQRCFRQMYVRAFSLISFIFSFPIFVLLLIQAFNIVVAIIIVNGDCFLNANIKVDDATTIFSDLNFYYSITVSLAFIFAKIITNFSNFGTLAKVLVIADYFTVV